MHAPKRETYTQAGTRHNTIGNPPWPTPESSRSAEEKAELWPRVVAAYKGYDGYQRRTERDIPLVICEPR